MNLYHFAHRGEASFFLKQLDCKALSENLYQANQALLLIGGEGIELTLAQVAYVIGKYPIKHIFNFGVAGALDKTLEKSKVYKIRASYAEGQFKSHTSTNGTLDCISAKDRVLSREKSLKLTPFAKIVDRELWGLAQVARLFNIPFDSYKVISDFASDDENCLEIRQLADLYSQLLFEAFELPILSSNIKKSETKFASKYQLDQINKLEQVIKSKNLKVPSQEHLNSKSKIKEYISRLEQIAYPEKRLVQKNLDKVFAPLEQLGGNIKLLPQLERKSFQLNACINSQANIDELSKQLTSFKWSSYQNILEGRIDV